MLEFILKLLASSLGGVFVKWLEDLQARKDAQDKAVLMERARQKEIDDEKIAEAARARDAVGAPGVPDNPDDFRD